MPRADRPQREDASKPVTTAVAPPRRLFGPRGLMVALAGAAEPASTASGGGGTFSASALVGTPLLSRRCCCRNMECTLALVGQPTPFESPHPEGGAIGRAAPPPMLRPPRPCSIPRVLRTASRWLDLFAAYAWRRACPSATTLRHLTTHK